MTLNRLMDITNLFLSFEMTFYMRICRFFRFEMELILFMCEVGLKRLEEWGSGCAKVPVGA